MASLKKIEELTEWLEKWNWNPNPEWIKGTEETGTTHISGQLREKSDELWATDQDTSILLGEAAEKLDDAHEEWLENQNEILQAHLDALIAGSTF